MPQLREFEGRTRHSNATQARRDSTPPGQNRSSPLGWGSRGLALLDPAEEVQTGVDRRRLRRFCRTFRTQSIARSPTKVSLKVWPDATKVSDPRPGRF